MEERQKIEDLDRAGDKVHRATSADALMMHYQGLFEDTAEGLDAELDDAALAEMGGDDVRQAEAMQALTSKVVRMQYLSKLQDECHSRTEVA